MVSSTRVAKLGKVKSGGGGGTLSMVGAQKKEGGERAWWDKKGVGCMGDLQVMLGLKGKVSCHEKKG